MPTSTQTIAGCSPTVTKTPGRAFTAAIADVDGDGKRDTEWAQIDNGNLRFGITTASGATIDGEQGFAGGADRSFVVGRLANGVVVAITSEYRDSPVFTFSDCAFHVLRGKDLLPGSSAKTQFTFYSEDGGGVGGCFDGRLALLHATGTDGDSSDYAARFVDVSADGLHARLTDSTAIVAHGITITRYSRWAGVSCGAAPVLHPVIRTG